MFKYYYNKSIRNYVVLFGTLFNEMYVKRANKDAAQKVPLSYASKERFIAYGLNMNSTPAVNPELQVILPRMSYYMNAIKYNSKNKVNTVNSSVSVDVQTVEGEEVRVHKRQLAPVPYLLTFELAIYARYEDDVLQIVEQILPYFQPHFNAKIKEYSLAGVVDRDIYINLTSVEPGEEIEGPMDNGRRLIQWTLTFDLSGYLYPMIDDTQVIKRTIVDFVGSEQQLVSTESSLANVTSEVFPFSAEQDDEWKVVTKVRYENER